MPDIISNRVEKGAPGPDGTVPPALRGLAKPADLRPVIAIDTREQAPLKFTRLQAVERALFTGDYSIFGLKDSFAIERKSLDDIANCCLSSNRDRFEHELHRLVSFVSSASWSSADARISPMVIIIHGLHPGPFWQPWPLSKFASTCL
jgi:hypothetical protein